MAAPAPLFSALLNYRHSLADSNQDDASGPACWLPGIRRVLSQERTNYPVYVSVDDVGTGFHLIAQCVAGIDPQRVLDYLAVAVERLADALEHDSQAPVRSLDVLPEAERELLLGTWNGAHRDYPRDRTVVQLFEEQAGRRAGETALQYEGGSLTYGELNARADGLAARLRGLGVRPGVLVGLCVERTAALLVGLLGTLKAGERTCRWIRRFRRSGWRSCCRTAGRRCC